MTGTPRHYMPVAPAAPVIAWLNGDPADDMPGRIAARRSFVHVKRCFMAAVERVDGRRGQWLRHQVRHTNEAVDLWLLRGAVFDALSPRGPEARQLRIELQRALDSVMPGGADDDLSMAF
jgi:AcrR family transcriptional regulator